MGTDTHHAPTTVGVADPKDKQRIQLIVGTKASYIQEVITYLSLPARMLQTLLLMAAFIPGTSQSADLKQQFANPPDSARPGVYWYFMDGNLDRQGMTADLEAMKAAGIGNLIFLEVNVGVPRGPVNFLSTQWQELFAHAVHEAEKLGIEITLGSGPGWTGSGGPWVKPEQSMQHLVAASVEVLGPSRFQAKLPIPEPRKPFFDTLSHELIMRREAFYEDVAVLAVPTPVDDQKISDIDEKALYYRSPFSSVAGVKPYLPAPARYPELPAAAVIPLDKVIDLTIRGQRPEVAAHSLQAFLGFPRRRLVPFSEHKCTSS